MKISEVMTPECKTCGESESVAKAAQMMAQEDFGSVPITSADKLVGVLTDRDIVVRGVAEERDLKTMKAGELMSGKVYYCYDDQECADVARNMGELQVRRMPVVDRDKRLVGVVSLGDLATRTKTPETAGAALTEISQARGEAAESTWTG